MLNNKSLWLCAHLSHFPNVLATEVTISSLGCWGLHALDGSADQLQVMVIPSALFLLLHRLKFKLSQDDEEDDADLL